MFQCLGLGTAETGGCGEDWWHPSCVVGLGPNWYEATSKKGTPKKPKNDGILDSITEVADEPSGAPQPTANAVEGEDAAGEEAEDEDPPLPPGFPEEDDFEGFICYKCVESHPWIKRYAGTQGFLAPVFRRSMTPSPEIGLLGNGQEVASNLVNRKKRKSEDDEDSNASGPSKRSKDVVLDVPSLTEPNADPKPLGPEVETQAQGPIICKIKDLPPAPDGQVSLFFKSDFRDHLCRCPDCFILLKSHPQLLEEEINYEPSISDSEGEAGGSTQGSGSIYDRGESALKNVDRVRAIEGVMAYNHLKEKLKPFFQQFAESGKAISAEDIKAHFAKMRGDEMDIKKAGEDAKIAEGDQRRDQEGH
jgi:E3 ubiquitin-protein ligase UBR7